MLRGFFALLLLLGSSALAGSYQHSVLQVAISSGAAFTGPGDIVSGATAWYGLRGYSAAVAATGTQKAINVRRQSDNVACDVLIATNGDLGLTSATCNSSTQGGITPSAFAGTDATCQGTISSTTLTCASASSTPVANDTVSGGGIVGPSYIVSCGTFTAGAGTCTLNAAQTVGVAETVTMQVALFVTKAYDQSGNTRDASQPTSGNQPTLLQNCINTTLPCMSFTGTASQYLSLTTPTVAQAFTVSWVAERTSAFTSLGDIFGYGAVVQTGFNNTANNAFIFSGSQVSSSATDSSWHSVQSVFNGASSVLYIDGTSNTLSPGASTIGSVANGAGVGSEGGTAGAPGNYMTAVVGEVGLWASGFSGGNNLSMCHNQFLYYSTATSC